MSDPDIDIMRFKLPSITISVKSDSSLKATRALEMSRWLSSMNGMCFGRRNAIQ